VSRTTTEKCDVEEFPALSRAVQATVVEPSGNRLPDAGLHAATSVPSRLSLAVTTP
jgi:hypothetical protein